MDFFWSKPDETCRNSSEYIFEHIKSNFSGLRNHPVLLKDRMIPETPKIAFNVQKCILNCFSKFCHEKIDKDYVLEV